MAVTTAAVIGGVAAAASAGVGIAGAAGAFDPDAPTPINYGQMTRDAQKAQIDLLPARYKAQSQFDPKFAALQNRIAYQNLFGNPGGTRTEHYTDYENIPATYRVKSGSLYGKAYGDRVLTAEEVKNIPKQWLEEVTPASRRPIDRTREITEEYSPGFLSIMEEAAPRLAQIGADTARKYRENEIRDVRELGPQALAALQASDPEMAALMAKLAEQAGEGLNAGSSLTPAEEREVQQYVRAGQSARGMGYGNADVFTEAMGLGSAGQQRLRERQQFAGNVINQRSQIYGDPFLTILGRSSGRSENPNQFINPYPSSLGDGSSGALAVASQNAAAANAAQAAGYNQRMSSLGALMGTDWQGVAGRIGGMFGSGSATNPALQPGNYKLF